MPDVQEMKTIPTPCLTADEMEQTLYVLEAGMQSISHHIEHNTCPPEDLDDCVFVLENIGTSSLKLREALRNANVDIEPIMRDDNHSEH